VRIETIDTSVVYGLETNCYLVADEATREAIVIDPGGSAATILERIEELGVQVRLIVNTHGHFDHLAADQAIVDATGAPVAAHRDALSLFQVAGGAALFGLTIPAPPLPTRLLTDGESISFDGETLVVLHTPGHTRGCISLWSEAHGVLFSGDLLFREGVGRTDLPGGNQRQLMSSIRHKIMTLPDETVVYPGHGPATTVGHERLHNPFLE
jgi:hydroxyacylglutathione hydrolase